MSTDSGFRQMATKILADAFGADGTGSPLHSAIETALAAAWAQGRDAAADVVKNTSWHEFNHISCLGAEAARDRVSRAARALTPAAVPSKENGE